MEEYLLLSLTPHSETHLGSTSYNISVDIQRPLTTDKSSYLSFQVGLTPFTWPNCDGTHMIYVYITEYYQFTRSL